jgi:hypothetical protein
MAAMASLVGGSPRGVACAATEARQSVKVIANRQMVFFIVF